MALSTMAGPDFICIGMQKSGTGWLFDQLKYHPDFWLPPVKELAYLLHDVPQVRSAQKQWQKIQEPKGAQKYTQWANRQGDDTRDFEFLREMNDSIGKKLDLDFYVSMFRHKEGVLSGDISSGYCGLNGKILPRLQERLPDTKILLLVRDPVGRAWSQINMWNRANQFDQKFFQDPIAFRNFLDKTTKFRRTAFPSKIVQSWSQYAPRLEFRHFLFDDIAEHPAETRREILIYLGADPEKGSGDLDAGYNKKSSIKKLQLNDDLKTVLVDYFAEELRTCREMFGSHAANWAARYGA